jgi:hypothetical protein
MLSEFADYDIGYGDKTMTAVSRVSAARPEAFWLARERGCDTLVVHDSARQKKCLVRQEKSPLVRLNTVVSVFTPTASA